MANAIGDFICLPCGDRFGRKPPNHISTWNIGPLFVCSYCGAKDVPVTEPRDFGYPKLPEGARK